MVGKEREIVRFYGVDPGHVGGWMERVELTPWRGAGAHAWVIDADGGLVVGAGEAEPSHINLAGGTDGLGRWRPVAGAGKVLVGDSNRILWVGLNHSVDYEPVLDARYARLVYDGLRLVVGPQLSHQTVYEGLVRRRGLWDAILIPERLLMGDLGPLAAFLEGRG